MGSGAAMTFDVTLLYGLEPPKMSTFDQFEPLDEYLIPNSNVVGLSPLTPVATQTLLA